MKKIIFFFNTMLIFGMSTPTLAQKKNAIGIKPINFSNLDLGKSDRGFVGRHFGIEYERIISQNDNWSIVLPLTFGWMKTYAVSDFYRDGYDLYITPGIKYHLKGFQQNKGLSWSANILFGQKKYEYSAWFTDATFNGLFYGFLLNNHYAFKLSNRLNLRIEAGVGGRLLTGGEKKISYNITPGQGIENNNKIEKWSTILNFSTGFYYRF